jgi:hypothetical protein
MIMRYARFTAAVRRARHGVVLLAVSAVLGVSSVVALAGTALPANADPFMVGLRAHNAMPDSDVATVPVGQTVILTATTSEDVEPTPYYIDIYDLTTGTMLDQCGSGVECDWPVSQSTASTQEYVAYVAAWDQNDGPPPQIQSTSLASWVTWTNDGIQIGLGGPGMVPGGKGGTYLAEAIGNLPPTFTIQIIDETTGEALKDCEATSNPECEVSFIPHGDMLEAFVWPVGIFSVLDPPAPLATALPWYTW